MRKAGDDVKQVQHPFTGRALGRVGTATVALLAVAAVMVIAAPGASARAVSLTLSATSGAAGTTVTVRGAGFDQSARGKLSLARSAMAIRTDRSGRFTKTVRIPVTAAGAQALSARVGTASAATTFRARRSAGVPKAPPVRFGVATPGGPSAATELDEVSQIAGERPSVLMWYRGFGQQFDVRQLDAASARGALPLLTWEPYDWTKGTDQPQYALARITAGDFDSYIRSYAVGMGAWGKPVALRFAHEMNGSWYPWSEAVNGNRPGDYVAAWRHVHKIFELAGATNVSFVWSPNVAYPGSLGLADLYPGDAVVDVVAVDGYNWGTSAAGKSWQSAASLLGPTLDEVRSLAPTKRLWIGEVASTETGGDKAAWIAQFFTWVRGRGDVEAFVWFDYDKETDWRVNSSRTSGDSFAAGLAARRAP